MAKRANTKDIVVLLENYSKQFNFAPKKVSSGLVEESIELLRYKKRAGTSGVRGQLYETKLSSLVLYRALTDKEVTKFYLGTNVDGVGDLDDVCFKYELNNDPMQKMIFIQAKHRDDHDKAKVSLSDLRTSSSDFSLVKYFDSYMGIKNMFKKDNNDLMFRGEIINVDCVLVLYTPSKNSIPDKYKSFNTTSHQVKKILRAKGNTGDVFQINDLDLIVESLVAKRITAIGELLKSSLLVDNEKKYCNLMSNDLIKRYHVVLARRVLHVLETKTRVIGNSVEKYREGRFRADFFSSKDFLIHVLKEKMFEGITAENIQKYKLESFTFKLPSTFGNIDLHVQKPQRVKSLGDDLLRLFQHANDENIVKIDESIFQKKEYITKPFEKGFLKLSGGIAGLVGNLLILDKDTNLFKFNDMDNLPEGNSKNLFTYLLDRADINTLNAYRLDVNIADFPTLFLDGDAQDRVLAREFLNKLWFFTNQPMESDIEIDLKKEIEREHQLEKRDKLLRIQSDAIFLKFHDAVQKWWIDQKNASYLTKKCDYLEKSKNVIIGSPKLTVLDFVFMNKMKKNEFKFKENVVQLLGIQDFLNAQTINVLKINTTEGFLTTIKVAQYFENYIEGDVTILDLEFIIDEGYYDMIESELKDSMMSETTKIFVFIHKRPADEHKLCDIIENICNDSKTMIIVISECVVISEIDLHYNIKCINDENIGLTDILNFDELSKSWTFLLQGQETKFDKVISDSSIKLINSNILWKLLTNEKIEIGKPFVNPRYDEVKEYCVPRKLQRGEEFSINTFEDIKENMVIVSAEPGMGKSILLNQLASKAKELDQKHSHQSTWIVYINLLDYSSDFKKWKSEKNSIDINEVLRFICEAAIDGLKVINSKGRNAKGNKSDIKSFKIVIHEKEIHLKSFMRDKKVSFEMQLFINFYQEGNVIFLLDGFDEICPHYEKEVLSLIKVLTMSNHASNCELLSLSVTQMAMNLLSQKSPTCKCLHESQQRLWITTRSYNNIQNALERALGRTAYTLKPL